MAASLGAGDDAKRKAGAQVDDDQTAARKKAKAYQDAATADARRQKALEDAAKWRSEAAFELSDDRRVLSVGHAKYDVAKMLDDMAFRKRYCGGGQRLCGHGVA
eukprot:2206231-Prymnesium_polylepis.1